MSDMSEMLRKMGLFSIGVISLTQEKLEEFTSEMVKKGEMNREEGKKFVREVLSERDKQLREFEDRINQRIKETIERSGIARRSDIEALNKRIDSLEKNSVTKTDLEALEGRFEVLERNTVTRPDIDLLERRIRELDEAIRSATK